jgi:polyhydroxybutyrate depolymerase
MNPTTMRLVFPAVAILLLILVLVPAILRGQGVVGGTGSGDKARSLVSGGLKRTFLLHVPPGLDRSQPTPLVIVLHGGGGTGSKVARLTRFSDEADREGFIVVYPDAINNHWNDGRNVARFRSQRENIDDVGFIATLIDRLAGQLNIDTSRVYVSGMSNGAMMSYRLACDLSAKIAAAAPVAGSMAEDLPDSCPPGKPVPLLAINGTEDPLVPYEGGGVGQLAKRGVVIPVAKSIDFWVARDQCSKTPVVTDLPYRDPNDGIKVRRTEYSGGREGSEVILYTVEGGGHTWPGGAERPERFGRRSEDFSATEVIWEFFKRHTRS